MMHPVANAHPFLRYLSQTDEKVVGAGIGFFALSLIRPHLQYFYIGMGGLTASVALEPLLHIRYISRVAFNRIQCVQKCIRYASLGLVGLQFYQNLVR